MKKPGIFFGWIIAICGALVLGVTHGVVTNCFSLYIIPVSEALGVTRDAFTVCSTIINAIYALVSFASGFIYSKVRLQTTMKISAIVLPVSYFCFSFCHSLAGFYLCAAFVGLSVSFLTFVPFTSIISSWFYDKRGTALGLCFMGSGLGGMFMNSLTALLLKYQGWRATYRTTGVIMLAVLIVMIFFVIRATPEEKGMQPLGMQQGKKEAVFGPTAAQAMRMPSFYALLGMALIIGTTSSIIGAVIAPHLCDLGYDTLFASNVTSFYLGFLALAKIVLGRLYDRVGARRGTAISMLGFFVGFLGLYLSKNTWALPLIMVAAVGTSASNVSYPVTTRFAFGTRDYQKIYGYMMGTNFVTCSVAIVGANRVYTLTGSYNPVLILCMALALGSLLLLPIIKPAENS